MFEYLMDGEIQRLVSFLIKSLAIIGLGFLLFCLFFSIHKFLVGIKIISFHSYEFGVIDFLKTAISCINCFVFWCSILFILPQCFGNGNEIFIFSSFVSYVISLAFSSYLEKQ